MSFGWDGLMARCYLVEHDAAVALDAQHGRSSCAASKPKIRPFSVRGKTTEIELLAIARRYRHGARATSAAAKGTVVSATI